MDRISADYTTLMKQGSMTALTYFDDIVAGLASRKIHPHTNPSYWELVATLVRVASQDYTQAVLAKTLQEIPGELDVTIRRPTVDFDTP